MDGEHPYWSWTRVHAHDVQTNRVTRLEQVKEVVGGTDLRPIIRMLTTGF